MAQGVDTSNLEAAQKKYDELKQPYDKLVEQRGAFGTSSSASMRTRW